MEFDYDRKPDFSKESYELLREAAAEGTEKTHIDECLIAYARSGGDKDYGGQTVVGHLGNSNLDISDQDGTRRAETKIDLNPKSTNVAVQNGKFDKKGHEYADAAGLVKDGKQEFFVHRRPKAEIFGITREETYKKIEAAVATGKATDSKDYKISRTLNIGPDDKPTGGGRICLVLPLTAMRELADIHICLAYDANGLVTDIVFKRGEPVMKPVPAVAAPVIPAPYAIYVLPNGTEIKLQDETIDGKPCGGQCLIVDGQAIVITRAFRKGFNPDTGTPVAIPWPEGRETRIIFPSS